MHSDRKDPQAKTRHRLEHVQVVREDQVKKMAEQNLWTALVQPGHRISDLGFIMDRLGRERYQNHAYPLVRCLRAGIPIAMGSDAPVDTFSPESVIKSSSEMNTVEEKISRSEALWWMTTGSRRSLGLDPGRMAPGSTVFLSNAAQ